MTARDRLVVIVVVALGILAGFWFLLIAPKRKEAGDLTGEITAQQAALQSARGKVQSNSQARAAYNRDYATVALLGKAVPTSAQVEGLLIQLNTASKISHVDFREIDAGSSSLGPTPLAPTLANNAVTTANSASTTPTTPTTPASTTPVDAAGTTDLAPGSTIGAGITTVPFHLKYTGNYFHLATYLQNVERLVTVQGDAIHATGRLLVIGSVSLKVDDGRGFPIIDADVSATAYERPADAQPTSTPSTPAATTSGSTAAAASTTPAATPATPAPAATAGIGATP